jgi:hypothetical protein
MMLNPKITKFAYTQMTADINPKVVPIITARIPHLLVMMLFFSEISKKYPLLSAE